MNHQRLLRQTIGSILVTLFLSACGAQATPVPTAVSPTPIPPSLTPTVIPSSTPTPIPTSTPTPGPSEMRSTILAAVSAQKDKSWRYQSDIIMADGKVHNTIFEYVPPDRYHIVSDSQAELVIIGQKVYVKQSDVWTESKVSAASIINPNYIVPEESTSDIQFIGTDSLNGKPMWVCQYTNKIKIGDTDSTSHIKLWIGATDNLPYKVVIDGEVAAIDSSTGKIVGVKAISTIFYEYDPTIKIDSPIK